MVQSLKCMTIVLIVMVKHKKYLHLGQDYEICPYATFSLPGGGNANTNTQTMDYSMQFQTFSQQECYAGQPRPSTSGYGGSKSTKDYYSHVRTKSGSTSRTSTDLKVPRTSKSPPDGLSLGM